MANLVVISVVWARKENKDYYCIMFHNAVFPCHGSLINDEICHHTNELSFQLVNANAYRLTPTQTLRRNPNPNPTLALTLKTVGQHSSNTQILMGAVTIWMFVSLLTALVIGILLQALL
eukprot:sb/3476292/